MLTNKQGKTETWLPPPPNIIKEYFTQIWLGLKKLQPVSNTGLISYFEEFSKLDMTSWTFFRLSCGYDLYTCLTIIFLFQSPAASSPRKQTLLFTLLSEERHFFTRLTWFCQRCWLASCACWCSTCRPRRGRRWPWVSPFSSHSLCSCSSSPRSSPRPPSYYHSSLRKATKSISQS